MQTKLAIPVLVRPAMAACLHGQAPAPDNLVNAIETPSTDINKVLPAWLKFGGDYRARFEGYTGGSFKPETTDAWLLSRLKLQLTISPTAWMKFFIEGMDARSLEKTPAVPTYQNTWDIRQAYGELGNLDTGIFGLRAGRQEMAFGEERLIGPSAWSNTERNWDAIRGRVRY